LRGAGSTSCCRCVEGLQLGGCSVGVGRTIEFAIQGCEEIPASPIFRFELSGPFGVGKGFSIAIQACICGGQIEPSAGFSWGELSGLFRGRKSGREVVSGIEAGCQLNPGSGIFRAASGGGFCGLPGIGEMARCEAGSRENRPGTRRLRIQAGGFLGRADRIFEFAIGKIKFAQPFRSICIFWIEPIGLDHFLDGQIAPTGAEEDAGEEAVRLGLEGLFENGEADIRFRFGQVVESKTGEGTTEKKAYVFRVFFDHLGDRFF
jgi:hypothetical protein